MFSMENNRSSDDQKIYVTRPFLPPLEEFMPFLRQIWDSKSLTNFGPFHRQLEERLCEYLGVEYISLLNNGTNALIVALKALDVSGEVITTPYSFAATTHALAWCNIKPVFVDIDPCTLNLDPSKLEEVITPQTSAILPVHCYGNPCDVDSIQAIADAFNLKVIYDAAHAFGVKCHCGSLLNHGDLSVLSFHATKVFNTFEGGAIISRDSKTKERIDLLTNFGFDHEDNVVASGTNAKLNEFQAALGLLQLDYIDQVLSRRAEIDARYREAIHEIAGLTCISKRHQEVANYSYFPILVEDDYPLSRNDLCLRLKNDGIIARKYFFPLISQYPVYRDLPSASDSRLTVSAEAASRVLCLPIYPELTSSDQARVIRLLCY
ncbi:DegT/DnrJ/EryC1/StrS family aminotransferase [Cyanobium sp. Candia 9D4]|uniref:DegT/DnrJ/EryC1/StrS family aminotransferase n=1 Tax=Cyanobium sp. Candia 9D4 TaxID=2823707 RepID=UPI0028F45C19|nr:DegT/DnrJ/EryC1/StrS family aminotransferase [Cyanobium sp. Candia 9D4]